MVDYRPAQLPGEDGRSIGLTLASPDKENPDVSTSGEAFEGIVQLVQFVHANSSETLDSLGNMTIPQIEVLAEGIRKFKVTPFGVGLGGPKATPSDKEHSVEDGFAFAAALNGLSR